MYHKSMNKIIVIILFFLVHSSALSSVNIESRRETFTPSIYYPAPIAHFDLMKYNEFKIVKQEINKVIIDLKKYGHRNYFCVVGYVLPDHTQQAVVIWTNQEWLYSWTGSNEPQPNEDFWEQANLGSAPITYLGKALVEKLPNSVLGTTSAYREDAEAVIDDCNRHGKQYVIEPFKPELRSEKIYRW